ncbi:hypothetical protein JYT89_01670 [Flavobacteriaceae bacterium AH-315-B10]|nr:hypothetical protein [Flavobacteriaceae bacterium AH-315-B10]
MEHNQTKKWYDNKFVIHLLLVIFFPIGLYALWKTDTVAKWWKITATILIGLIVIANIGDDNSSTDNSTTEKTTIQKKPEIQLTQAQKDSISKVEKAELYEQRKSQTINASDLVASYVANEVSADENFKGKKFYVYGKITDIKKDILGDIYVTLKGSEMFREVQCYFDDTKTAAKLKKGMYVTFYGKCDGLMMNVLMKNCKITENLND